MEILLTSIQEAQIPTSIATTLSDSSTLGSQQFVCKVGVSLSPMFLMGPRVS